MFFCPVSRHMNTTHTHQQQHNTYLVGNSWSSTRLIDTYLLLHRRIRKWNGILLDILETSETQQSTVHWQRCQSHIIRYDVFVHWHCHYSILAHVRHGHGGCCCWSNATQINLTFSISVSASAQHMLPAVTLFRVHVKEMRNCFRTNGIRHIQYATIRCVCVIEWKMQGVFIQWMIRLRTWVESRAAKYIEIHAIYIYLHRRCSSRSIYIFNEHVQ